MGQQLLRDLKRPFLIGVMAISLFVYGYFTFLTVQKKGWVSDTAYYNYFVDSLLTGSLAIEAPNSYDLAHFEDGRKYMVWGPAAALLVLPFYLVQGLAASDLFYTAFFAWCNCLLFCLVVLQVERLFDCSVSELGKFLLGHWLRSCDS